MPFERIIIDLAIKKPLPEGLNERPTPEELKALSQISWFEIAMSAMQRIKGHSQKINPDRPEEELTVTAKIHECRHDVGEPCVMEREI